MNQVKQPMMLPDDVCALSSVVMAAVMLKFMQKAQLLGDVRSVINLLCTSFMGMSAVSSPHRGGYRNKICVYFFENEKKGIVTMYDAPVHSIKICENGRSPNETRYEMTAVLDKMIVGQGKNYKAVRKIGVESFNSGRDKEKGTDEKPHVTLLVSGKSFKRGLEALFVSPEKGKSISLNLKSRRYVEYNPIPMDNDDSFLWKALKMSIDRKSFLVILLKKYLSSADMRQNLRKATYLAEHFSYLIPHAASESLKKTARGLYRSHFEHTKGNDNLENIEKFISALGTFDFTAPLPISEEDAESLKVDALELVKERAFEYENLHEILNRDSGLDTMAIGVEEIIACYPTSKGNHPTNTFFKKAISSSKDLSSKMHVIHGFIDTCKISNKKLHCITLNKELLENVATDTYAYGVLRSFAECDPREEGNITSIGTIIEKAREVVSQKYAAAFGGRIVGITERISANVSEVSVKIAKVKNVDELSPHSVEPISLDPMAACIAR
ncbi:MAG: hypothetical protein AB8U44_03795 [Aaplasma endosymbiont of Hyalomma asiaticum]